MAAAVITELPRLLPRPVDAHKGDFGRVLIVAGSRGMSGAAALCGLAALRGGAGLVRVALPGSILPLVAVSNPCLMTAPLPDDAAGQLTFHSRDLILQHVMESDAVAIGCGLGRSGALDLLIQDLVERCERPLVLDADGLNALIGNSDVLRRRKFPTVLTPHPGEFARLIGASTKAVQAERGRLAESFARDHGVVLVLKGAQSIVTDGSRTYVNTTGNPGMATGGSGDVLTGLLASLIGQGLDVFGAAQLATHLHGLAGDLARNGVGEISLIATDIAGHLPQAFTLKTGRD